jgi:hypothetical protein
MLLLSSTALAATGAALHWDAASAGIGADGAGLPHVALLCASLALLAFCGWHLVTSLIRGPGGMSAERADRPPSPWERSCFSCCSSPRRRHRFPSRLARRRLGRWFGKAARESSARAGDASCACFGEGAGERGRAAIKELAEWPFALYTGDNFSPDVQPQYGSQSWTPRRANRVRGSFPMPNKPPSLPCGACGRILRHYPIAAEARPRRARPSR